MKICFNVIHIDNGNEHRNMSNAQIVNSLSKEFTNLNSNAINLISIDDAKKFVDNEDGFNFLFTTNYPNRNDGIFPHRAGVVGVWASNFTAWKKFNETDNDVLLVFEDDVFVTENFIEYIKIFLEELPEEWDFFSFFVPPGDEQNYNSLIHQIDAPNVCKFYQGWSCAGYAISKSGVRKAIEDIKNNEISLPIDWYIFGESIGKFNTYNVKPYTPRIVYFNESAYKNSYIDETGGIDD